MSVDVAPCTCGHDVHSTQRICLICSCRGPAVSVAPDVLACEIESVAGEVEHRARMLVLSVEEMLRLLKRGAASAEELRGQLRRVFSRP